MCYIGGFFYAYSLAFKSRLMPVNLAAARRPCILLNVPRPVGRWPLFNFFEMLAASVAPPVTGRWPQSAPPDTLAAINRPLDLAAGKLTFFQFYWIFVRWPLAAGRVGSLLISGQKTAENCQKSTRRAPPPTRLHTRARAMFLSNNYVKNDMDVSRETLSIFCAQMRVLLTA